MGAKNACRQHRLLWVVPYILLHLQCPLFAISPLFDRGKKQEWGKKMHFKFLSLSLSFVPCVSCGSVAGSWWFGNAVAIAVPARVLAQKFSVKSHETFFYLSGFSGAENSLLPFPPAHSDPSLAQATQAVQYVIDNLNNKYKASKIETVLIFPIIFAHKKKCYKEIDWLII